MLRQGSDCPGKRSTGWLLLASYATHLSTCSYFGLRPMAVGICQPWSQFMSSAGPPPIGAVPGLHRPSHLVITAPAIGVSLDIELVRPQLPPLKSERWAEESPSSHKMLQ